MKHVEPYTLLATSSSSMGFTWHPDTTVTSKLLFKLPDLTQIDKTLAARGDTQINRSTVFLVVDVETRVPRAIKTKADTGGEKESHACDHGFYPEGHTELTVTIAGGHGKLDRILLGYMGKYIPGRTLSVPYVGPIY